jgi:pseudouridylate synthase / pseudouridine kinase
VDLSCDYSPFDQESRKSPTLHTSNPASISQAIGGVGRNVATAAHLAGASNSVRLCSLVADDIPGRMIISSMNRRGLDTSGIRTLAMDPKKSVRTAQYVAVNDQNKDLVIAMADMRILSDAGADFSNEWLPLIKSAQPKWVIVDANWNAATIGEWIKGAKLVGARVAFEPVSVSKSRHLFPSLKNTTKDPLTSEKGIYPFHSVDLATPNVAELEALHGAAKEHEYFEHPDWWKTIDALGIPGTGARDRFRSLVGEKYVDKGVPQMMVQLLPYIPTIITKLGADGTLSNFLHPFISCSQQSYINRYLYTSPTQV